MSTTTPSRTYRYEWQRRQAAQAAAAEATASKLARVASCGTDTPHSWRNWEYSADYTTESRSCRECGATETRSVRL